MKKVSPHYKAMLDEGKRRTKEAKRLRKQNYTWTAIGKLLGVSRQRAFAMGSKK